MHRLATMVLFLNGIAFAGTGIYAFAAPVDVAASVGLVVNGAVGHNEFLATFGGMLLAFGVYLLAALRVADLRAGALLALGVLCAGLFAGRVVSAALHGLPAPHQFVFGGWELVTACLALTVTFRRANLPRGPD